MKNKIICGDCLGVMRKMNSESVDLIYLDPPFSSDKQYIGFWQKTGEKLVFDDHWEAGIKGYIEWLTPRIKECHRVLKDTGSIYIHCDWHANAHIRIMMDKVFGVKNFRNEIVWYYYNKYSAGKKCLPRATDTIYFYTKTNNNMFNPLREKRKKPVKQLLRENVNGVLKNKKNEHGKVMYRVSTDKKVDNVWRIPCLQPAAKERLGYPTQKPEALLERIIKASSNEGDVVLDPYCGCGTTISVASKLNRNFIGIDISRLAIKVMDNRLKKTRNLHEVAKSFEWDVIIPNTIDTIKEYGWFNFQTWVNEKLGADPGKRGADGGIDGTTWNQYTVIPCDYRKKNIVVQKDALIQSKHYKHGSIGEPDLKKFKSTIERNGKTEGIMTGWKFAKPNAYEFVLWAKEQGINIYLLKAEELYKLDTLPSPYKDEYKVGQKKKINDFVD